MSDVRKWYIGVYGGEAQARTCSPHPNEVIRDREGDTFVLSRDHMAALASANNDKEAYAQNAIDLRKRVDALQALLTAADEREDQRAALTNDDLIAIARNAALNSVDRYNYMPCLPEEAYAWEPHYWVIEAMRAALKPAEPAKDEHVCTGCGSKGWTANCKECVPY